MSPRPIIPGYYVVRLVSGGTRVPGQIIWNGFVYRVEIDGRDYGTWTPERAETEWGDMLAIGEAFNHPLLKLVIFGRPVSMATYLRLCELRDWARKHNPGHSAANPRSKVDLNNQDPIF